jgi:elongation factor G
VHLNIAFDRLKSRFNLPVKHRRPSISYRETIRSQTKQHARFKRQSGGHGQFADIHIEIWPQPRGAGFEFHDKVVGGAVPRTFIGSVEEGIREYLQRGPLGFPVVDVAASLFDGQYHAVDSSDMAFKTAAWVCRKACPSARRFSWSRSTPSRSPLPTSSPPRSTT